MPVLTAMLSSTLYYSGRRRSVTSSEKEGA